VEIWALKNAHEAVYHGPIPDGSPSGAPLNRSSWALVARVDATAKSYLHTGVMPGQTWRYRLVVRNKGFHPMAMIPGSSSATYTALVRSCPKALPTGLVTARLLPPSDDGTKATQLRISWTVSDFTPDVLGFAPGNAFQMMLWSPEMPVRTWNFTNGGASLIDLSFGNGLRERTNHTFKVALLNNALCPPHHQGQGPTTSVSIVPQSVDLTLMPSGSYATQNFVHMGLPERTLGQIHSAVSVAEENKEFIRLEFEAPALGLSSYAEMGLKTEVEVRRVNDSKTYTKEICSGAGCSGAIVNVSNASSLVALNVSAS
jgi:hypothetical protein